MKQIFSSWKKKIIKGKHREIKHVTTQRRWNCLVPEPNYRTKKFFTKKIVSKEMKRIEILRIKSVYLGLSILEFSKILMYEFLYDYVKSKHGEQAKLGYIDTGSYIVYMETDDISKNIGENFDLIWY